MTIRNKNLSYIINSKTREVGTFQVYLRPILLKFLKNNWFPFSSSTLCLTFSLLKSFFGFSLLIQLSQSAFWYFLLEIFSIKGIHFLQIKKLYISFPLNFYRCLFFSLNMSEWTCNKLQRPCLFFIRNRSVKKCN